MAASKKQTAPARAPVLIANISPGLISTPTVKGFLAASRAGYPIMLEEAPPYLDDARNRVIANAYAVRVQVPWEHILFVDSDIAFGVAHLKALFAPFHHPDYDPSATPVMCGLYYNTFVDHVPGNDPTAQAWVDPVCYEWTRRQYAQDGPDGPERWGSRRLSNAALTDLPGHVAKWNPPRARDDGTRARPIVSVGAVGTGFMCIHESVLTDLANHHDQPTPWFAEPVVNKAHLGEDIAFCHRVRALGYPVLVNRACLVPHGKTMWLP